jgi:hypothetical protein
VVEIVESFVLEGTSGELLRLLGALLSEQDVGEK